MTAHTAGRTQRPIRRLLAVEPRARALLATSVALGVASGIAAVAAVVVLAGIVDDVFVGGADLAGVTPALALAAGLLVARGAAVWSAAVLAQEATSGMKARLRVRLARHLVTLGPVPLHRERSGELAGVLGESLDALDPYLTSYRPARVQAVVVPAVVFAVIAVLDPWTTLVLGFAGPMLLLLLALIGGRTRAITDRRFQELRWLDGFFLDLLQGLGTLKAFGRSREEADTIAEVSSHYGRTTMEVLRTAFQTSLVMEWAATAATALVAVQVGFRLVEDAIAFGPALAVLMLTPEFFAPLRRMATEHHAGAGGDAAAERIVELLDTPVPEHCGPASTLRLRQATARPGRRGAEPTL
ncbi:MAG: ABC transporter transmembrane domain-containing protein, partial [Acidimicrobiales bacterium]